MPGGSRDPPGMSSLNTSDRFNEENAAYALRGRRDATDLATGLAAIRGVLKTPPARPGAPRPKTG